MQRNANIRVDGNVIAEAIDPGYSRSNSWAAMPFPPLSWAGNTRCGMNCTQEFNPKGKPEAALNQKVKNLIQKLGEAIHESVSESENIAGVVKNIRDQGFDVMLMLEATIGLNQVDTESESSSEAQSGVFTHNDLTFLKSLRITLPESDPESGTLNLDAGESADSPPADE